MRIPDLLQRPSRWLRVVLASLLLAFALNTVAHAAHEHDPASTSSVHALACGYCHAFGGLAGVPEQSWSPPVYETVTVAADPGRYVVPVFRPCAVSQPRAPPLS